MDAEGKLGAFLRARRELVQPEDVGLPRGQLRRVPGLRREEVAMLAGISAEYYLRLERGRDRHPSAQVLDALARVLQLDYEGTAYLHEISRDRSASGRRTPLERVPVGVRMLLDTLNVPAFVVNRYRDVLAANTLAARLSPLMRPGVNRLRAIFLDPIAQHHHPDWERDAAGVVAQLRIEVGADSDDPRLQALVGELSVKSDLFRRLWARHDVGRGGSGGGLIRHPELGDLELRREKLQVIGNPSLTMVVYHAEPGTTAASALKDLTASIAAKADRPRDAVEPPQPSPLTDGHDRPTPEG